MTHTRDMTRFRIVIVLVLLLAIFGALATVDEWHHVDRQTCKARNVASQELTGEKVCR